MADDIERHDEAIRAWTQYQVDLWGRARRILEARRGWHFDITNWGPAWGFGEEGASRLVVTVQYDGFLIYDHENDKEHWAGSSEEVVTFMLDKLEPKHAGLTDLQARSSSDSTPGRAMVAGSRGRGRRVGRSSDT